MTSNLLRLLSNFCRGEDEKTFEVHVIAKSMSTNATRNKIFRTYDFFRNEIMFYEKVIIKFVSSFFSFYCTIMYV